MCNHTGTDFIFNKTCTAIYAAISYVCIYVCTHSAVISVWLTNQGAALAWIKESYCTCRFRLPTQPTNTFQLQLTHTAAATAKVLCCYTLTLSEVYPHASKSCLGKQGTCQTWISDLLRNTSKGFPGTMVKPSTDFIQLLLNEHKVFWIFIIPWSSKCYQCQTWTHSPRL